MANALYDCCCCVEDDDENQSEYTDGRPKSKTDRKYFSMFSGMFSTNIPTMMVWIWIYVDLIFGYGLDWMDMSVRFNLKSFLEPTNNKKKRPKTQVNVMNKSNHHQF